VPEFALAVNQATDGPRPTLDILCALAAASAMPPPGPPAGRNALPVPPAVRHVMPPPVLPASCHAMPPPALPAGCHALPVVPASRYAMPIVRGSGQSYGDPRSYKKIK
jgi:hypothetical protein